MDNADQLLAERYLLGELDDQQLEDTERRLEDDLFFRQVRMAEDELIDAYLSQELSDSRRQQFEQHFLRSTSRRQRLEVSRLLFERTARQRPKVTPPQLGRALAIAALVMVAAGASWTVLLRQELAQVQRSLAPPDLLVIPLVLGVNRSSEKVAVQLGAEQTAVRLQIRIDERDLNQPVEIVLRDPSGQESWRGRASQLANQPVVEVHLPQGLFAGSYEVEALSHPAAGAPFPIGYAYFDLAVP